MRILVASLILVASVGMFGCGPGKTPEEIEAAKYPQTPPLSPEDQKKAEALGASISPTNPPPSTSGQ